MRKLLKWTAIGLAGIVVVVLIAAAALYVKGGLRINQHFDVAVAPLVVPTDSAAVARGRHLAEAVTLCIGCHGDDLSGDALVDEPMIATIYASNLTAGRGGVGGSFDDADYVRAIRHGVNPAGRGLMIMHSDAYQHLSATDLGALIAFIRSMPPVDKDHPATKGGPLGRIFVALGFFDRGAMALIPAEIIDHDAPLPEMPAPGTPAHGRYLVSVALCRLCHGADLTGGPPFEEGAPPAPDVAALAVHGAWSEEQFVQTLRTGVTPYGKALDGEAMPWEYYGRMSDEELRAIWRYLATLGG